MTLIMARIKPYLLAASLVLLSGDLPVSLHRCTDTFCYVKLSDSIPSDSDASSGCVNYAAEYFGDFIHYYKENEAPKVAKGINLKDRKFVRQLQRALHFHGYLGKEPDGLFDEETAYAVKSYKRMNALPGPGVDSRLVRHLSVPSKHRAKMLEEALDALDDFSVCNDIYVNIPEFKVRYYRDGDMELKMDAIVGNGKLKSNGRDKWFTYVQEGILDHVTVNPYWCVPPGDLTDETREDLRKSASLRKTVEQFVDGSWVPVDPAVSGSRFRQLPCPRNALGRAAYELSGGLNQFLHGTPNKKLFKYNVRNFSHGCMRLEDELEFFRKLQKTGVIDKSLKIEDLISVVDNGKYKTQRIELLEPVNVHVVYVRAWVEQAEEGLVMIMPPDVYDYGGSFVGF